MIRDGRWRYLCLFVLTLVILFSLFWLGDPEFKMDGRYQRQGSRPVPTSFPVHFTNDPVEATYLIRGNILFHHKTYPVLRVVPDDCVEEIKINDTPIDLSSYSRNSLCDTYHGFEIDLSPYLREGNNASQWTVKNTGGAYGLSFQRMQNAPVSKDTIVLSDATIERLADSWHPFASSMRSNYREVVASHTVIEGKVMRSVFSPTKLRIDSDACIRSFEVNGIKLSESLFPTEDKCGDGNSTFLDLSPFLGAGSNQINIELENFGGPYSFRFVPSFSDTSTCVFYLIILVVTFFAWNFGFKLFRPTSKVIRVPIILAIATFIRFVFVFYLHAPEAHISSDSHVYFTAASQVANGFYQPGQLFQSVLFPQFLAWTFKWGPEDFTLFYGFQVFFGMLTVFLTWLGSEKVLGERAARWVLLFMALQYQLIALSGFFMPETLFSALISLLFFLLAKYSLPWNGRTAFGVGVVTYLGLAVKGNNAFFVPALTAAVEVWAWYGSRGSFFIRSKQALALSLRPLLSFYLGLVAVILVIGVYTSAHYGRFQVSASSGALNLVEGKCPAKSNFDSHGNHWQSPLFKQLGENESKVWPRSFSDQEYFLRAALECVENNPKVLFTSFRYVYYLFFGNALWPANISAYHALNRTYSVFYGIILFPGILAALVFFFWRRIKMNRLPYLLVFSIVTCAWAIKSEMRYRVPFDAAFITIAIAGWKRILEAFDSKLPHLEAHEDRLAWIATLLMSAWIGGTLLFL